MSGTTPANAYKRNWFDKLLTWRAPDRVIHDIPVWMPWTSSDDKETAIGKVENALTLLSTCAPQRFERVRRLGGILIFGTTTAHTARYLPGSNLCQLWETLVLSEETTLERLALTLVHEATHAWLFRRGFGYEESIRYRVERVCIRAERLTALRLPDGALEVERSSSHLENLDPEWLKNESFHARDIDDLRKLGCPEWIISLILRVRALRHMSPRLSR